MKMIKVYIPNDNLEERHYILDIILSEFLGLSFEVEVSNAVSDWILELEDSRLTINDSFFNKFKTEKSYISIKNIPDKIYYVSNSFIVEKDIPILYGNDTMKVEKTNIYCGIDVFSSSFFMLTRWEEYANNNRDKHNRFPATESTAFKNDFLHRPIVNEYVEMLWNMLLYIGCTQHRKKREYEFMVTHDVDIVKKFPKIQSGLREILADFFKRRQYSLAFSKLSQKIKVSLVREQDPFDTFDWLMDLSEKVGVKSYFFFMAEGKTSFDNYYKTSDRFVLELIDKIKERNHYIGMHPTYNAYNDKNQFKKEKLELEKNLNVDINYGREHYLRFEIPTTWQVWEDNNMLWDSTLSYADKEGFRCGVCYQYSVFNILTRKKLKLKEKPLIVMEGSFVTYQQDIKPLEMEEKIRQLINRVKKYNGTFIFLWHNSSFNVVEWKSYKSVYENILKKN